MSLKYHDKQVLNTLKIKQKHRDNNYRYVYSGEFPLTFSNKLIHFKISKLIEDVFPSWN